MSTRGYSRYLALSLVLGLLLIFSEPSKCELEIAGTLHGTNAMNRAMPCDEIYVVREDETLQTISEKCGDPFILEDNPHIYDPDDVYAGLVLKITPYRRRSD